MSDRVVVSVVDGVADVRLNRPDKLNALDGAMFQALVETGVELARDRGLRAAVLSGEGRAFCAGLDFASFAAMDASEAERSPGSSASVRGANARSERSQQTAPSLLSREEPDSIVNFAQRAAWVWTELPVPVIAAVHGVAYGGGLQIALAADLRLVAPDARLSVMEIKWGLVPDMSGTQTLRRLTRLDVAKELTYTGRVVSGTEAVALGLATRAVETPREAALELAREIAGRSPDAVRAAKRLLDASGVVGLAEGLRLEEELQRSLIGRPNQIEAVRANVEKRAPRFRDPS
ncbi:MAG TPA: crotonase/enoyl-CoA hydratase family protein [Myxococcota bacterium]|nr:crotonase/enoyl-CoA hydratase family protein [Myxococcota bacterium]